MSHIDLLTPLYFENTISKFYFSFQNVLVALAMAQDDERKVPPRTPAQRLNTLKRFAGEWINAQIGVEINRPSRAQNMINIGIERLESKMTEAASKDCFFFDPTVEHGGPNPASASKYPLSTYNCYIHSYLNKMANYLHRKTTRN